MEWVNARRAGRGQLSGLAPRDQLLLWELLYECAIQISAEKRHWHAPETIRHASPEVKRDSIRTNNLRAMAIDDGVALLNPLPLLCFEQQIDIVENAECLFAAPSSGVLHDPTADQLIEIAHMESPDVAQYLESMARDGASGSFQYKVALTSLLPPVRRVGQNLRVGVRPLSYWTVREFNRADLSPENCPRLG